MGPFSSNRLKLNFLGCKSKIRQKIARQKACNLVEYILIGIKVEKRKGKEQKVTPQTVPIQS